jgi:prostaglandin-E synthase
MFILIKKENDGYWPRLLKDAKKYHWLKIDWNKWKDEDDEEEVESAGAGAGGPDFDSMFRQMGGMGGMGGLGGLGGMGMDDMPNLDDLVIFLKKVYI